MITMAKKKTSAKATGSPQADRLAIVVTLKGSAEWKEWVDGLADHCRTDVSKLIDRALVNLAKTEGYNKEAPRR
jgi:hypothetical protein